MHFIGVILWILICQMSNCQHVVIPSNATNLGTVTLPGNLHAAAFLTVGEPEQWNVTIVNSTTISISNEEHDGPENDVDLSNNDDKRNLRRPIVSLRKGKRYDATPGPIFTFAIAGTTLSMVVRTTGRRQVNMIGATLAAFWTEIQHTINTVYNGDGTAAIMGPEVIPITDNNGRSWWLSILAYEGGFITWDEWRAIAGSLYTVLFQTGVGRIASYQLYDTGTGAVVAEGYYEDGVMPTNIWYYNDP